MVIPSFSAFAPAPKMAESWLGGIGSAQRDTEEADRVAIAGQQIGIAREKLQQEAVQSNMQLQAQQKAHQDQMMRDQQEMLIKDQYQKQLIGMKQMQLEESSKMVQMKTREIAQKFQAQQAYKAEAEAAIQGGEPTESAYSKAAMKYGPAMGMTGAGMASLLKGAGAGAADFGQASAITGLPAEQYQKVRTSTGGYHIVHLPPNMDTTQPAPPGYVRAGNRLMVEREPIAVREARKEIISLEKAQQADVIGKFSEAKAAKGDTLSPDRQKMLAKYQARQAQIDDLRKSLPSAKTSGKFKEGQTLTHKKTGDKYKVTNGVPVLVHSAGSEGEDTLEE